MSKIVLTGTTGQLGSSVFRHILGKNLIPTSSLIVSLYNPASAPQYILDSGIPIRRSDYHDEASLLTAYEGADTLFLVSYPGFSGLTDVRIKTHTAAINAAKKVGIRHIVYTSLDYGGESGETTNAVVMEAHAETVRIIKQSGLDYTIIRESTYAEIWNIYAGLIQLDNVKPGEEIEIVVPPHTGGTRFTAREDLGEATAIILANLSKYKNQSVVLHASYSTSVAEIAEIIREHTGHKVNLRFLPEDEVVAYHLAKKSIGPSTSESFLRDWLTFFSSMEEVAYVDNGIEEVLGRKARSIREMKDELFGPKDTGSESLEYYAK